MVEEGADAVKPNDETVANGTYPISRFLYNYTNGTPEGVAEAYLEFALNDEGQRIVEEAEYVASPADLIAEQFEKLQ